MEMGLLKMKGSTLPVCLRNKHCWEWARIYMKYCLCSVSDGVSITFGCISVMSWFVAEIPQIVTNFRDKSTEGLSIAFLFTWILGDLFNLFGCMLEPATLPTQLYMAVLYSVTTSILFAQAIYYGHIYHKLNNSGQFHETEATENVTQGNGDVDVKQARTADRLRNRSTNSDGGNVSSSPIHLPSFRQNGSSPITSPGRYYKSARSLSSSQTPTAGSFLAQQLTPTSLQVQDSIEEPLLGIVTKSTPAAKTRTMLCVVSAVTLLGTLNLHQAARRNLNDVFENTDQGLVMQVSGKLLPEIKLEEGSSGFGTYFGWAMAATYMSGRLPQICLNIKRGHVEGLNPFMFIFALVGNITYVASILIKSLEWSSIRPNLPWLADAVGCVLLDFFILAQFIYFRYRALRDMEGKIRISNAA